MKNLGGDGPLLFVGYDWPDAPGNRKDRLTRSTAEEALERIRAGGVRCVVSAYDLPDGTGIDLLEAVREIAPDLPVVLWTENGDETVASRAVSAGVTDYVIGDPRNENTLGRVIDRIEPRGEPDRELARAKRRYETIVDRFPNGIITLFDENRQYQLAGGTGFETLALSPEDLEGRRLEDVFPPDNVEVLRPLYDDAFDGQSGTREVDFQGRDFRVHVVPIRDDAGQIVAGMTMSQDITERKDHQRELERARERYKTLVDAAPDPIFVADAGTGEIVETNAAAESIMKQPREEIIGSQQSSLHPAEDADRYRELFDERVGRGGTFSTLRDGSPLYLTTADGTRIPVEISVGTVELRDRSLSYGIFRDVSELRWYERSLEEFNRASGAFFDAETETEIAQTAVEVADEIFDVSGIAVYLHDEETGELRPIAYSTGLESLTDEPPTLSTGNSILGRVYADQELARLDDVRTDEDVFNPGTHIRSGLYVPLGDHGVITAIDTEIGAFDETTADLFTLLGISTEASIDRIERTTKLRQHQQATSRHAQKLERVNEINRKIRSIIRAVVQAETRGEIQQAVCDNLRQLEQVGFVWIGETDRVTSELTPEAWAGDGHGYLDSVGLGLDSDSPCPAIQAARQLEPTSVETVADGLQQASWRQTALLHEHRSILSVPIRHDEITYGVLSLCGTRPAAFDTLASSVLTELGELVGYSLRALEQRNAFLETGLVEITYRLTQPEDTFVRLAARLEREIEIRNVTSRPDETYVVHGFVTDVDPDRFREVAGEFLVFDGVRILNESGPARFEVRVSGSCIVTTVADLAARMYSMSVAETGSHVTLLIPQDRDVRSFTDRFRAEFPNASLVGRRDAEREPPTRSSSLLDQLTDRQQEILEAAYFAGFFERPRQSTGSDIADSLGISQPAFSKQLRNSERNLLEPLYEPE